MNRFSLFRSVLLLLAGTSARAQIIDQLGQLPNGDRIEVVQNPDKSYGLRVGAAIDGAYPVQFIFSGEGPIQFSTVRLGYQTVTRRNDTLVCTVDYQPVIPKKEQPIARVTDRWLLQQAELRLWRRVDILADDTPGFASGIYFVQRLTKAPTARFDKLFLRSQYEQFIPGITYGTTDNLPAKAIGAAPYSQSWIREDRMPIPMVAIRRQNGLSLTLLNPAPIGETTLADSQNFSKNGPDTSSRKAPKTLMDERFRLGAFDISLENQVLSYTGDSLENRLHTGYVYPALEGPVTYRGNTYPDVGEQAFRLLFHPIRAGFSQSYSLIFRFTQTPDFPTLMRDNWRWAWAKLQPQVNHHDLEAARRSLIGQLSSQVETHVVAGNALTGITNWRPAVPNEKGKDPKTVMGFTGKALETAEMLLWAANRPEYRDSAAVYRRKGEGLFSSFIQKLTLNPPNGEGFNMTTGQVGVAIPGDSTVYLRSFGDDLKATLRAYNREKQAGRVHADWLAWAKSFGDWLLTQQRRNDGPRSDGPQDGAIPRSWHPARFPSASARVADPSATSSYNAVPMLLLLSELTGESKYEQAAIRAGNYAWNQSGQRMGRFTGGTIDNPDVLDKEAGTLSLEAYLALYQRTTDKTWLYRARAAADFAETWIYGWNVPMPTDADNKRLHWKKAVPTTGLQLISTGHSLVDGYMAFDADEYAKLAKLTHDDHYLDIARLLLHNTLGMTALPGRLYDLRGPGWQQEHWSLAPWRGYGFHRGWLPWVSTSHLNGLIGLEEFDPVLYAELIK